VTAYAISAWLGAQYPGTWVKVATPKAPRR
jgi:hypothetical protein